MRRPRTLGLLAMLTLVAACGTDSRALDDAAPAKLMVQAVTGLGQAFLTRKPNPDDPAVMQALRAQAEATGQPQLLVSHTKLRYAVLHRLVAQNGDVQTWSSPDRHQVALRGGMLVATRGFGPDLMSAEVPGVAQIASGAGTTHRRHFYLDGADQRQVLEYSCQLAVAGSEAVVVLGLSYQTRKVTESCTGPDGSFENAYWFDAGQQLRQSSQHLIPGLGNLLLQRVTGAD